MSIIGWYYLHTNGSLIYKRELGGTAADIRESNFARAMWACDPSDRIKQMIARHADIRCDVSALKDDTHFRDHLGADDLVRLDISYEIEEEFSIVFDPDNFEFDTVGELIAVVEQKLQDKLPQAAKVA